MKYELKLSKTTHEIKKGEKNSHFAYKGHHLIARYHEKDENGNTICRFGKFEFPLELGEGEIFSYGTPRIIKQQESKSSISLGDGEVIISRSHEDDENGWTTYEVAKMYARIGAENDPNRMYVPIKTIFEENEKNAVETRVIKKESDGEWAECDGYSIIGRDHNGDENAKTVYRFAKFEIDIDQKSCWKFIMAADTQYPWSQKDDREVGMSKSDGAWSDKVDTSNIDYSENNDKLAEMQVTSMNALLEESPDIYFVMVNGDLVNYNNYKVLDKNTDLGKFRKYYEEKLETSLYLGLGNHDYEMNVGDTYKNSGPTKVLQYFVEKLEEMGIKNADYTYEKGKEISGSLAYSFDVNELHFIQLNFKPNYTNSWEGNSYDGKVSVKITKSYEWLKKDLQEAKEKGKLIIICVHTPKIAADNDFKEIIKGHKVVAVFVGHEHCRFGPAEEKINNKVPLIYCGSTSQCTYILCTLVVSAKEKYLELQGIISKDGKCEIGEGRFLEIRIE